MKTSTRMTLAAGWAVALGTVPLGAVFEEWTWIWYAWAAVAAVVGAHLLARSARLPAALVPLAGVLGLLVYLTLVFAADAALLGLVPTLESMESLAESLRRGMDDVNQLAAPVPPRTGLVLLTSASVGAVAIVVDVIAVGLRRPAAAGLPLLALYAVPTAVAFDGVPWMLFAIGATGYLVLLLVEGRDRLLRWGRPVGAGRGDDAAPLPLTGQRIGAAAIALAVVVPLLVPGLTGNALSRFGRTGSGEGIGAGGALNEFASLRGQLTRTNSLELMRVRPNRDQPFYLRTKVLDRYQNGGGFTTSRDEGQEEPGRLLSLPPGQGRSNVEEQQFSIDVTLTSYYRDDHLPIWYFPLQLDGPDDRWRYDPDKAIVVGDDRAGDFSYQVTGVVPDPSAETLASAGEVTEADRDVLPNDVLRLPPTLPEAVERTVETVTGAQQSQYLKAKAINDYFTDGTNGFTYSLGTVQGNSGNALVDFLSKKQGYCEQYAAAMGVMLRVAGIPSRVVLGYTPGVRQDDGSYVVTSYDAHAWVEAYFHDLGWVFFDPTPLGDGRTVAPPYAPRPATSPTPSATTPGVATGSAGASLNPLPREDQEQLGIGAGSETGLVTPQRTLIGAGLLAALLLALAPAAMRWAARRRRLRTAAGSDAAEAARAAWDEVVGTAADYGLPVPRTETPRGLARRLGRDLSLDAGATAGLRLVALAEERARYAQRAGVDGDLPDAVRAVRRGLREHAGRRGRWRATLLPPSTVQAARYGSATRAATASTALSRLGEAVRRPVTPRRR